MRKGERTRAHIVEQAAALFNCRGFAGASLSDIMAATGLQKGGIYRHFESKEELALEAFTFATRRMSARFSAALEGKESAMQRLQAVIDVYVGVAVEPPVPGGCPVLSAAAESDYGDERLRARARTAVDGLRRLVRSVVAKGIEGRELRADVDPEQVATVFTATLEGGILLTQLYGEPAYVRRAATHLEQYVDRELRR